MKILLNFLILLFVLSPLSASAAPLTDDALRGIITSGVSWLVAAQEESGHFKYEYVPYEGRYRADDNIVRQAGAFFELGEIARMDDEGTYDLEKSLVRSARYFEDLSVQGSFEGTEFRCVKASGEGSCKLGATALAAIGLLDLTAAYPAYREEYEVLLNDYRAYILAMKKDGAGFRYYYNPKLKTQRTDESSFSNGEAFFALVRFEERESDVVLRTTIDETFTYLEKGTGFDSALYLWAMAGLKDLQALRPNPRYVAYADRYTAWRLADNARYRNSTGNRCAYIEGIASAHALLSAQTSVTSVRVEAEVDAMLEKTAHLQVKPINRYRYVGGDLLKLKDESVALGGFLTGSAADGLTQRIDFTQHCLSAYAQTLVDIRNESL